MGKFFKYPLFLAAILGLVVFASCSKDDDGPGDSTQEYRATVSKLNADIESIYNLLAAEKNADVVTDIKADAGSYTLTFKSGTKVTIAAGTVDAALPGVSVKQDAGSSYWSVILGGEEKFLENSGNKVPVTTYPVLGMDNDGYWTLGFGSVSGSQLKDANGQTVKVLADTKASLFKSIDFSDGKALYIALLGGSEAGEGYVIELKRSDVTFEFYPTSDGLPTLFEYGQTIELAINALNVTSVADAKALKGWSVVVDMTAQTAKITAPAATDMEAVTDGKVVLQGKDKNGNTVEAACAVYTLDYSHPAGTFFVINGNMGSENGSLNYLDQYMREHTKVYEKANGQREIGNVLEDMYVTDGKVYFVTQNGPQQGGDGFLVVCNGRTMVKEKAYASLPILKPGATPWIQHIVVVSPTKAYIQYRDYSDTKYSGIRVVNPQTGEFAAQDVANTNGHYDTEGAWFARMAHSRGKVFVACRKNLVIIDAATDASKKIALVTDASSLAYIKDVVKGSDGNIYALVTGNYTGSNYSPNFTSKARLVVLDHEGTILKDMELPAGANIGVSPSDYRFLSGSFTSPDIYIKTGSRYVDGGFSLCHYNILTGAFTPSLIAADTYFYGYPGVHPVTGYVYLPYAPNWTSTEIRVFDPRIGFSGNPVKTYTAETASPEGATFGYRFSKEWIAK